MSIETLKNVLSEASKNRDDFPVGTVIRWLAAGRYVYAAIKTPRQPEGWYTTSASVNGYTPKVVSFEELLEILGRSDISQVMVSATWTLLTEDDDILEGDVLAEPPGPFRVSAVDINVQAQRFYEATRPALVHHVEKPVIVKGLRLVLENLGATIVEDERPSFD